MNFKYQVLNFKLIFSSYFLFPFFCKLNKDARVIKNFFKYFSPTPMVILSLSFSSRSARFKITITRGLYSVQSRWSENGQNQALYYKSIFARMTVHSLLDVKTTLGKRLDSVEIGPTPINSIQINYFYPTRQ